MYRITCFSFKGGAGRSTAAANISSELAKRGKKVLLVDVDLNAPGLHYVFGVEPRVASQDYCGTHHLLRNSLDISRVFTDRTLIDLGVEHDDEQEWPFEAGSLYLMARSHDPLPLSSAKADVLDATECMRAFAAEAEKRGFDYFVMDAASGIGHQAAVCYNACDLLLVFYRWTRQHVKGAAECVGELQRKERVTARIATVASGVPGDEELDRVADPRLRAYLRLARDYYSRVLEEMGAMPIAEIAEYTPLKWSERVVTFDTDLFSELTDNIVARASEAGA